jgi:hypothetical protein
LTRRIGVFGYNFFTQQGEKWLKRSTNATGAGVFMSRSFQVVVTQLSLWGSSLIDIYAKCGRDAWRVFNKMPSQDAWSLGSP